LFSGCAGYKDSFKAHHDIQTYPEKINLIWSKEQVFTIWSTFDVTIDASNNKFCFLGGFSNSNDHDIVCLNGTNGNILWQESSKNLSTVAVTPDGVFVAYDNFAGIEKYNYSGKVVWRKSLGGTGSNYLYVIGEQIQILTLPEKFWVLDFDGNEIKKYTGDMIFTSTSEGIFMEANGIQLLKNNSKEMIWQYDNLDDVLEMSPLFIDTKILVRTGQESGSIYALDRTNGEFLWKTEDSIVSNVVYSPSTGIFYALTRNGELLTINEDNGQTDVVAKFSSVPFVLNGEANVGSYQLAYDLNENILFVSLGDSRQLFVFKEQ
jgi:outer membrane protein assembly factor BamB